MSVRGSLLVTAVLGLALLPVAILRANAATELPDIYIVELQTRTEADARDEFITLHNDSSETITLDDWELQYATATADIDKGENWGNKLLRDYRDKSLQLGGGEYMVLGSNNYADNQDTEPDVRIDSGSRYDGGHIRLIKPGVDDGVIDYVAWGDVKAPATENVLSPPDKDQFLARCFQADGELQTSDDITNDFTESDVSLAENGDKPLCEDDDTPNSDDGGSDHEDVSSCQRAIINEVYPNPESDDQRFIELINLSDEVIDGCEIEIRSSGGIKRGPYSLDKLLKSEEYTVIDAEHEAVASLFSTVATTVYLLDEVSGAEIDSTTYPESMPHGTSWARFEDTDWRQTAEPTPGKPNFDPRDIETECHTLQLSEVMPNPPGPRSQYPREEYAFIELYNPSDEDVALTGCSLHAESDSGQSGGEHRFDDVEIPAGEYRAFMEEDTEVSLPVNPSGTVRLLDNDGATLESTTYPENMPEDAAWAFIDAEWQVTYSPTPNASNQALDARPCPEGQERNPDTGRCRNVESASSELVPCEEHQYRHPETNRCRNIDQGDELVPCEPHQERNPETNRCRNVESASSELVPCEEHQYRHPETNRCRNKVIDNEDAMDEVEDVVVTSTGIPPSYWMLGVVSLLAGLYAVWEWRVELLLQYRRGRHMATRLLQSSYSPPTKDSNHQTDGKHAHP